MKRMKKKVVAMVTLAMFLMTLLPMAAFAAVGSTVEVDKDSAELTMENGAAVTATINLDFSQADAALDAPAYVWLTKDGSTEIYRHAKYPTANTTNNQSTGELKAAAKINKDDVANTKNITVELKEAGKYTVHAGIAYTAGDKVSRSDLATIDVPEANSTITVIDSDVVVNSINVPAAAPTEANKGGTVEFKNGSWLVPNGYNKIAVTATVTAKYADSKTEADPTDQKVTIDNPYSNIDILDMDGDVVKELSVTDADGDKTGEVEFQVLPDSTVADGYYIITLNAGDKSYDLTVKIGEGKDDVKTLEVVNTEETVFGTTSDNNVLLDSVAQFVAKDEQGNEVTDLAKVQGAAAIELKDQPKKATSLNADDFSIAATDNDTYTLKVAYGTELKTGDYWVRVYLENERSYVDFKFTVKEFDEAVDIVFGDVTGSVSGDITDEVVFGEKVSGKVFYVDKNGVRQDADDAVIGVEGPAVKNNTVIGNASYAFRAQAVDNDRDAAIGSKVTVTVYDSTVNKKIEKEFTVVDSTDAYTLAFDSNEGKVQANNNVKVTVVDENDKLVKVGKASVIGYYVASNSNDAANIHVTKTVPVTDGKGEITIYSDKATVAEIVVYTKIDNKVYGNTLKYTFGEQDIPADTSVVMTLGSTEMLVNNEIVNMKDAAPFAQDNRTFVPFRALGEALGAQVDFDKDAKTVTYELGGTKIVMTLDSKTYTVNGTEKTMDVAPFAKDNRTYVPVRFVGEALGFKVTGLQNANGQYVAVAFTK